MHFPNAQTGFVVDLQDSLLGRFTHQKSTSTILYTLYFIIYRTQHMFILSCFIKNTLYKKSCWKFERGSPRQELYTLENCLKLTRVCDVDQRFPPCPVPPLGHASCSEGAISARGWDFFRLELIFTSKSQRTHVDSGTRRNLVRWGHIFVRCNFSLMLKSSLSLTDECLVSSTPLPKYY